MMIKTEMIMKQINLVTLKQLFISTLSIMPAHYIINADMNRHFVEKFNQNLDSEHFVKAKSQGLIFSVEHYAGQVSHNLDVSFYPRSDK